MTTIQTIALNKLVPSKANVRRTNSGEGIEELAHSIATHGLRQNLNVKVTEGGKFEVVAGGRRFRALKLLAKQGAMAKNAEVPCNVLAEEDDAGEISLVENTMRVAMHPDDQFEAFRQMVDAGKGVEDVAARFGVTPAVVERRLKLARVSPKLRAMFRAGELSLDHMMAFAVVDDHTQQEETWAGLAEWNRNPRDIRTVLTREAVALSNSLARFVTEETYVAAGGAIQRDLFSEQGEGYMPDRGLVLQLAAHKLEAAVQMVEAEGWKWVKAEMERDYSISYGRIHPSFNEDEAEQDGERVRTFAAEDIARAGAIVRIGHDGELDVSRGLVHPDDMKAERRQSEAEDSEPQEVPTIPASVVKELSTHRTAAIRLTMTENPQVALASIVHTLALPLIDGREYFSCLEVSRRMLRPTEQAAVKEDCSAHAKLADHAAYWGERLPSNPANLFGWCLAQPQDVLLALLAYCSALSVNAIKDKFDKDTAPRLIHADALAESLTLNMADYWQPSVQGFYGKLSKAALLKLAQEAGAKLSLNVGNLKKPEAAQHVREVMAETAWLPDVLRGKAQPQEQGEA
ncbi:MAG: hypothetical protein DI628_00375 [Blastochloris viridis]|uniref:ParB-like N-terminal domain-containing protein n=1 Tax=Blastochloris viridis TaxID=1079 RepID=A0A6N4RDA5_BLAVI|nr:MAG: hypothetical protein DI628_00375 [Blastochloris viridis]